MFKEKYTNFHSDCVPLSLWIVSPLPSQHPEQAMRTEGHPGWPNAFSLPSCISSCLKKELNIFILHCVQQNTSLVLTIAFSDTLS